jgi:hypothetical protein
VSLAGDLRPHGAGREWHLILNLARNPCDPRFCDYLYLYADLGLGGGKTDSLGAAHLTNLPDTKCSFYASLPGYSDGFAFAGCSTITMVRGAAVAGTVVTEYGLPLPGGEVSLSMDGMNRFFKTLTGSQGEFRLEDLPPSGWDMSPWGKGKIASGSYHVTVEAAERAAAGVQIHFQPGEVRELVLVALPGVRVRCRVIDTRTEEPISGARIGGRNARGLLRGFTDGEGIFQTTLLPGESMVFFHSPPQGFYTDEPGLNLDSSLRFDAQGSEMSLTLRAPPLAGRLIRVRGKIVNFEEAGAPRTVVHASPGPSRPPPAALGFRRCRSMRTAGLSSGKCRRAAIFPSSPVARTGAGLPPPSAKPRRRRPKPHRSPRSSPPDWNRRSP